MKTLVETERLILREIELTDIDGMYDLDSDHEVHKYLGNNPVKNKEETLAVIHFIRQQYIDNGIGRWAIIDKATNDFIGWTGLKYEKTLTNHHINYYDIGYRLRKKYWGKGIATESARAMMDYAFDTLQLEAVYAMADCANEGSNKILQKIGLAYIEQFDLDGVPHNWYKVSSTDYKATKHNK